MAASRKSQILTVILFAITLFITFFPSSFLIYTIDGLIIAGLVALLIPIPISKCFIETHALEIHDERDIMFSRRELVPGTDQYNEYYRRNPDKEPLDLKFREQPGLLANEADLYHEKAFNIARSKFEEIEQYHQHVETSPKGVREEIDPDIITADLKSRLKDLGALNVGFTKTKAEHYYSHKGRGKTYGQPIIEHLPYAIAFTVEMDLDMVMAAPKASIVAESATQYLNAAKIATEIARYLRNKGYKARTHIDGNYQVICPLVARDAGLGEIGRMGLLMTPNEGPRVRLGVITTDIELLTTEYQPDYSVLDFCRICKKCAECCPSQSISSTMPESINGVKRWQINADSCFTYWCKIGTDCGRCMAVCPYAHPNTGAHKLIRYGIKKSTVFRHLALHLDDFFYGKKPVPKPLPKKLNLQPDQA